MGREWRMERSIGKNCRRWRYSDRASPLRPPRPCAMVGLTSAHLHHQTYCTLWGCSGEACECKKLWYTELAADVAGSKSLTSLCRLQRVCSHINIKSTPGDGSARKGPPASGIKTSLDLLRRAVSSTGWRERTPPGPQMSRWHRGGEPWKQVLFVEPSLDIVGV